MGTGTADNIGQQVKESRMPQAPECFQWATKFVGLVSEQAVPWMCHGKRQKTLRVQQLSTDFRQVL